MPWARTISAPSSARTIRNASRRSSPTGRLPGPGPSRRSARCSEPMHGRHGRATGPTSAAASTRIATRPSCLRRKRQRRRRGRRLADRRVDRGQAGHRVGGRRVEVAGRVHVRPVRHGQDVPAAVIDRGHLATAVRATHEVAGGAFDRRPADRDLPAATLGTHLVGWWQHDVRRRSVALGLCAERLEPGDPRVCRAPLRLRHGAGS